MEEYTLGKFAAIISQSGQRFYERELASFGIGWGQIFFLLCIDENQGVSILELARKGFLDQSTATRALQKMERQGYIRFEVCRTDRRIRRAYTTEAALPVIEAARAAQKKWHHILIQNMSAMENETVYRLLDRMAHNAFMALHETNDSAKNYNQGGN